MAQTSPFPSRARQLRKALKASGPEWLLVAHRPNVFYLCGFTGSAGMLLMGDSEAHFFTDGRYTVQAKEQVTDAQVHVSSEGTLKAAAEWIKSRRGRQVLGFEARVLTVAQESLLQRAAGRKVALEALDGTVESLRSIKMAAELSLMRKAARLGCDVLARVIPLLKPGIRELEVAAEIEFQMRKLGASGPAFDTIIASGARSALPHAQPSSKRLRKNELVVLDLGAILNHYCCDLTRTVFLGKAPERVKRLYGAVLKAQEAAREAIRPGVSCGEVDAAARNVLAAEGLEQYFTHSTGHGLGLEV
ncbi:MAG: aminopeptidase P family protein, partial [Acidobacteria bacterium]|nr:aminopeptidase P family protein [Acidobacteriota bacterium]